MPWSRDILQRFRAAGTPGAAAPSGVPADRVAEVRAELEPVFALLAESEEEAARIRADAESEAERRRHEATAQAHARLTAARREAAADRTEAGVFALRDAEHENAAVLAEAEQTASVTRRRATERMPDFVEQVTTAARNALRAQGRA